MKIGIDIDDTISETYEIQFPMAQYYTTQELKKDAKIEELTNLTTHFQMQALHRWNKEEEKGFFDQYYKEMLEKIKPKFYAKEIMDQLKKEENELYLITARFDWDDVNAEKMTESWLKEYEIPYDLLIVDAQDKAKIAKKLSLDAFLDDSYSNCEQVSNLEIKTYLMDSRVNRDIQTNQIKRIYSWPHFYQKIKEDENGSL